MNSCDAEQLSRVKEFLIRTEQHLWIIFLAYSSFIPSTIAFRLECVLFDQLYAEIAIFFDEEMFGSVAI